MIIFEMHDSQSYINIIMDHEEASKTAARAGGGNNSVRAKSWENMMRSMLDSSNTIPVCRGCKTLMMTNGAECNGNFIL